MRYYVKNSKILLLLIMFSLLPIVIFANEVPENKTIYFFDPVYFNGGDRGNKVLDKLLDSCLGYDFVSDVEKNEPNLAPKETSLVRFIEQLEGTIKLKKGVVVIRTHGNKEWLVVETYSGSDLGLKAAVDKKAEYSKPSGIPASDLDVQEIHDAEGKFYALAISSNYIKNYVSQKMGNKSIVFGGFCYSDTFNDAFKTGGKVYNYFGFDCEATSDFIATRINNLFERLGGKIDEKRNYTVDEAMAGVPSYPCVAKIKCPVPNHTLLHRPIDDNAKTEVIYNSPKILELTLTQYGETIYKYVYSDLTYPFVDGSYPGDLSLCGKKAAKPGRIDIKIRFSESIFKRPTDTGKFLVQYDPLDASISPIPFNAIGIDKNYGFSKTYFDDDTWASSVDIPSGLSGYDGPATIIVRAKDTFSFKASDNTYYDASSGNPDGELDTDGNGKANGLDKQHIFGIDTSIDPALPVVSEIFPPEGYVTDMNDQDISANISDSVGLDISTIKIELNGEIKEVEKSVGDDFCVDIRYQPKALELLKEGVNKWKVIGQDTAGNQIQDIEHTVIVDTLPTKVESFSVE